MSEESLTPYLSENLDEFNKDTLVIGEQTDRFLQLVYPGYCVDSSDIKGLLDPQAPYILGSMTFFKIARCSVENVNNLFESVNSKIEKLFTALHSINVSVAYGIISNNGVTNLVLGVKSSNEAELVKKIVNGILSGIELNNLQNAFSCDSKPSGKSYGILSGVPTVRLDDVKQIFSLSSIMKALNGENYTVLFLAKPVKVDVIQQKINELIDIKDKAFAVSKHNITRSSDQTDSRAHTDSTSDTTSHSESEGTSKSVSFGFSQSLSTGMNIGGSIGIFGGAPFLGVSLAGSLGASISSAFGLTQSFSKTRFESATDTESHTIDYSDTVSKAITNGQSIAIDIQNSFAMELMNYADKSIERFKESQNNGVWQTAICYSADSEISRNIIKACLCGELSKPDPDKLPMVSFEPVSDVPQDLLIPKFMGESEDYQNSLCSYMNSSELGLLCTPPVDSVPDFELRTEKQFPMLKSDISIEKALGQICDGKRRLNNMPFGLSDDELNKHTFVCGITGSGKTTTVKRILINADKPFMVIEPAKKEYRGIPLKDDRAPVIYTLGKPEINCLQINPFYIMPGISSQMHIDFLKDLFIASFSFYGPMPYILEKCLHNVYKNKGWNLTLGYHPLLNKNGLVDLFDKENIVEQYEKDAHKYLFPTMQELKDEITRYVKEEMDYDGEVAGNVKTAIKIRLENLCVGAKGYMFNTYEHPDMGELLSHNTVFELEGLADDSDKAFCVGFLIVLINEYRHVAKESSRSRDTGLSHLLVIEEAHRLLKNVDTERTSENIGNPKGKAVEHFTNMLAEMRSYGQGVIVAEQIPSKLAPEVIKNSSNKIIQRLVSADDQQIIANTIGISEKDAILLGTLEKGYGLCHKEGMSLPVFVNINDVNNDFVDDGLLYNRNLDKRLYKIDLSSAGEILGDGDEVKIIAVKLLNTLLAESDVIASRASALVIKQLDFILKRAGFVSISQRRHALVSDYLTAVLLNILVRGIYSVNTIPDDNFVKTLHKFVDTADISAAQQLKTELGKLYGRNVVEYGKKLTAEQVKRITKSNEDISSAVRAQFVLVSDELINEICFQIAST